VIFPLNKVRIIIIIIIIVKLLFKECACMNLRAHTKM